MQVQNYNTFLYLLHYRSFIYFGCCLFFRSSSHFVIPTKRSQLCESHKLHWMERVCQCYFYLIYSNNLIPVYCILCYLFSLLTGHGFWNLWSLTRDFSLQSKVRSFTALKDGRCQMLTVCSQESIYLVYLVYVFVFFKEILCLHLNTSSE